jgi:hypothetical protein
LACPTCQNQYENFQKEFLEGVAIIYGAKKDKPTTRKCDDCKVKKATIFTVYNPENPNDKLALCEECNQKRPRGPRGNQQKREQIKIIFEKVLARCPEEGFKPLGEQNGKKNWCVYTPIWVKRITKEEARELKELCQEVNPKMDIPYVYWLSQDNYKYDFEKTFPQFIQELDKIIDGKETRDKKHNEYTCERCNTSCWKDKGDNGSGYYRKRITHWYTDFRKTVNYFCIDGDCGSLSKKGDSKCAEEFKKEHQQTCPQCQKTEWPDMAKGWMLDYEIHQAFCSPDCHVKYRKLSWEQADQLTQIEVLPPELELSSGNSKDFDWEKEGSKKEILYWRESVKELQRQLEESKKKPLNQRKPNEIPHQARQISYLLILHQNSQQKSEQAYQDKYGKAELDALISSNSNNPNEKGMSGGMIALLIIGGVILVGGIIFLLTRSKKKVRK